MPTPGSPAYRVVAMSMPVVYTLEGDHDPDGLIFTLAAYRPMLEWARAVWRSDEEYLPTLHDRRQRIQLVVDGLRLLPQVVRRLRHGPEEDQDLLAELIRSEHLPAFGEAEDRLRRGSRPGSPRDQAVRTNALRLVDDIRFALTQLGAVGETTDATGDVQQPALVSIGDAERAALLARWSSQLVAANAAVEAWFVRFESDPARRFDADALAAASGISADRVKRLMLNDHRLPWTGPGSRPVAYDRFNPLRPIPVVRPLVLRARRDEPIVVRVENSLADRRIGFHVLGDGMSPPGQPEGVHAEDGSHIGGNLDSTIPPGGHREIAIAARHEGVWPINDLADVRGTETGSNVHGLFGTLIVEAPGTTWRDPETGDDLTFTPWGDGLYVDVTPPGEDVHATGHGSFVDFHLDDVPRSFREFTIFLHDEPEVHSGLHTTGEHSIMPLSYRAEPMPNRLPHRMRRLAEATPEEPPAGQVGIDFAAVSRRLGDELDEEFWTARRPDGDFLERVAGEEQHHSSWLFGEPITPVLRAYQGDPCRVRLVHAGVKETHVFHLHVHQWRAVPQDTVLPSTWGTEPDGTPKHQGSQLLDSITIGPQTAVTIDPLYGSGSRQHAVGDIIWHCHLYPHFHHGMWGLWRSFDRLVEAKAYPDGTPCPALVELPGRSVTAPSAAQPGFPWFMDATFPRKSPPPPVIDPAHLGGRRSLLQMPLHSPTELEAFAPGCRANPKPGALFVDLDGDATAWNREVGLPDPRIVSYDVEVLADRVDYNRQGWHDPLGHHYRLLAAEIRQVQADKSETVVVQQSFEHSPDHNPEPFFPRANHGDIVELRLHNALRSFPADAFDVAQLPVECGLHVHLVKFDPLTADGSSTGWNYLSGASCREAVGSDHPGQPSRTLSLHRWVVDEEFGPCFFHDHLLANYRQKHGLFAALIAEPHGSQWNSVDQTRTAWADPQAVILPPVDSGLPPYRDAGLAVADFVPLLDQGGRALNPPGELSGDDDPGSMAVNYRGAPMTFRGTDPSTWFSAEHDADAPGGLPDTPTISTYPGERMRIRLIQGSHEESHGFATHGLRWHREWHNEASTLVNQQTLGISEAFTLDLDPAGDTPYGPGDHLWRFSAIDDTWLGCWGLVRALVPSPVNQLAVPTLPVLDPGRPPAPVRAVPPRPPVDDPTVRTVVVVARRVEHRYVGDLLTDPWGLAYHLASYDAAEHEQARETGEWLPQTVAPVAGPLVLRARRGEWIRVFLVNEVVPDTEPWADRLPPLDVEPSPPALPLEHFDELGRPDERSMSARVSLHPNLLLVDVTADDGAYVGVNQDGTVAALDRGTHGGHEGGGPVQRDAHALGHREENWTEAWWYADDALAPESHVEGPGRVCLLEDLADVRNHRHHGLFGALVVEPGDVTPYRLGASDAPEPDDEAWTGASAELRTADGALVATEAVAFVQNGLRLFVSGHPDQPVPDVVPGDDPEDSGQRGISYQTTPIHRGRPPQGEGVQAGAPVLPAHAGHDVWLRVVGAGDKPRAHTLTVHGASWSAAPWLADGPQVGGVSGVANGWAETLVLRDVPHGDHAIRSGAFRWDTELGVWALLRVNEP